MRTDPAQRGLPVLRTVAVVGVLVGLNIADHVLGWSSLWIGPAGAMLLVAYARACGLTWHELGMARATHGPGLRWGLGVVGVVALVYAVGVAIPATRTAFLDARYHLPPAQVLITALLVIPVGTVLLEEVAFRSVLWGMLQRHARTTRVLLASSALFGLWHVLPALSTASSTALGGLTAVAERLGIGPAGAMAVVVVATVLFTALGGVVAGELRRRSGSVLASMGMHWATNGLGVLVGMLAWQLA
ncbi:MAG TPA: CPBP family intramembrane metalloprotease [Dermatophilaceae bacterium]|nr:CPBP family intramembrane metalloprotease [Dermatophilaceae bacterium]